jgi:hypothetical protein
MDDFLPLGEYEQLKDWAGRARSWGPDGEVRFGANVLDGLVELIEDFRRRVKERFPVKTEACPVILGCVPWLTSPRIADALVAAGSHCICVDKKSAARSAAVHTLLSHDGGVANELIPGLRFTGRLRADGSPPVVKPPNYLSAEGECLEPVRVVGWSRDGKRRPLLHAKLAALCAAWRSENDFGGEDNFLTPLVTWFGSGNWTETSSRHIEFGAWTTDEDMCNTALSILIDVIRCSETPTSVTVGSEPELADAKWDDVVAFAEYAAEYCLDTDLDENRAPDAGSAFPEHG